MTLVEKLRREYDPLFGEAADALERASTISPAQLEAAANDACLVDCGRVSENELERCRDLVRGAFTAAGFIIADAP